MNFDVIIIGSGAAIPTQKRNPTCQFVDCNDRHILIDCGEGSQLHFRKNNLKFQKLQHILISHLHGDHYFGLVGLLSTMHLLGRDKNLSIYGPVGLKEIVLMQLEFGGSKLDFEINWVPLDGKSSGLIFEDKLIEIHTFPLKHRIPTNGFLIKEKRKPRNLLSDKITGSGMSFEHMHILKEGKDIQLEDGRYFKNKDYTSNPPAIRSYAFCSDTAYSEKILEHIEGVNLLYHEATFIEKEADRAKKTYHSTAKQAATIAQKAKVKKLILGHLSARYENGKAHEEEAKSIFENTEVVEDGVKYSIKA
ncbi:MAG: ribonuclease Z [Bacteroidota bacterium]